MNTTQNEDRLPPGQQLVAAGRWPFVGQREPRDSDAPWTLTLCGLVDRQLHLTLDQLSRFPQTTIEMDIHCVTRWSKFDARFSGVLLKTLLDKCGVDSSAKFVSFEARTQRGHSSSLQLDQALELGCLLATSFEGQPLPVDHGGPLRSVVPRKYFYKSVKWVERIDLLAEDRPGYWESDSGYHNHADPWKEQRYIASSISKRQAAQLVADRNFSGKQLLGIDVSGLELNGLNCVDASLRNANFQGAQLVSANFSGSNLSNANFQNASLNLAVFHNTDLEGANFSGADLRGANMTGCSLFGASFAQATENSIDRAAKIDHTTAIEIASLERLTRPQRDFVQRAIQGS